MYNTLQEALGLGKLDQDQLKEMFTGEGEHIPGYFLDYRVWEIDGVTISVPEPHGNNYLSRKRTWEFGHQSKSCWQFSCDDADTAQDGYVLANNSASASLPLRLSNSHVHGLIIGNSKYNDKKPRDTLSVRASFVAAKMTLFTAKTCRKSFKMSRNVTYKTRDSLLFNSELEVCAADFNRDLELFRIQLVAPVAGFKLSETPHLVSKQSLNLQVVTPSGILDVFYALQNTKELKKIQEALRQNDNGLVLDASGWLIGDCATGRYKKGTKYDLPHNLRLAGIAIAECHSEELLSKVLSDDAVLIQNGRIVGKGPSEIYEWFESHIPYKDNPELTFKYAWKQKKTGPLLLGIALERDYSDLMIFLSAEMGTDNRLSILRVSYVGIAARDLHCEFSDWVYPKKGLVYPKKFHSETWDELDQDRVKKLAHVNGNFWPFYDVLSRELEEGCADNNGIKDLLSHGKKSDEAVRKILNKGIADSEPRGQIENLTLYETKRNPGFCFEIGNARLKSKKCSPDIYSVPSLPGCNYSGKVEVLATRDLDGRLAGDIAVRFHKDQDPFIFRVPGLKILPVLPGDEVGLEIYGIAVDDIDISPSDTDTTEAEDFLNSHSYHDGFTYFVRPIESIDHVDLYGEPLVSFKVPLQRSNEKTVFVQIYANKESVSADVKPGDFLEVTTILMARIHSDSDDLGS